MCGYHNRGRHTWMYMARYDYNDYKFNLFDHNTIQIEQLCKTKPSYFSWFITFFVILTSKWLVFCFYLMLSRTRSKKTVVYAWLISWTFYRVKQTMFCILNGNKNKCIVIKKLLIKLNQDIWRYQKTMQQRRRINICMYIFYAFEEWYMYM